MSTTYNQKLKKEEIELNITNQDKDPIVEIKKTEELNIQKNLQQLNINNNNSDNLLNDQDLYDLIEKEGEKLLGVSLGRWDKKFVEIINDSLKKNKIPFTNRFVYLMLRKRFENYEFTEEDHESWAKEITFRQQYVQQMFVKKEGLVADHIAYSAVLKIVFSRLKTQNSIRLYNILFAMFLFNCDENLQILSSSDNKKKQKFEQFSSCCLKSNFDGTEKGVNKFLYENISDMFDQKYEDEEWNQFTDELCEKLSDFAKFSAMSGSLSNMIIWVTQCYQKKNNNIYTLVQEVQKEKSLDKKVKVTPSQEFNKNPLNIRLFFTLLSGKIKNLQDLIDSFEEVKEEK